MIWNQKGRNVGLLLEIFFSFLVLFLVGSFIIYNYNFYRQNLGFDYEPIWTLNLDSKDASKEEIASVKTAVDRLLSQTPEVQSFAFTSGNMPYGNSTSMTTIKHQNRESNPHYFSVDSRFLETMNIKIQDGRWLEEADKVQKTRSIVITETLREELFGDENPINQIILDDEGEAQYKVVGLIENFKSRGEFAPANPGLFQILHDSLDYAGLALLKIQAGTSKLFEAKLQKQLNQLAGNWSFRIAYMKEQRADKLKETQVPIIILLTICGFLIFNVALGLFGVLWNNISKRKAEIGIRRALGSTKSELSWQFIGEILVLSTFSILLGSFFAIQFPLLKVFNGEPFYIQNWVYLLAIVLSALLIYGLVIFCAFFPSRQAANLHPAIALHEE